MKKASLAVILCASLFACTPREVQPPNILWIFTDDHAVQAIGAYGGRLEKEHLTPNLDRLAAEGMIFDRSYVANSICAPSRATLLTGKFSHRNGQLTNLKGEFDHNQPQFQKYLQQAGYQTAIFGKIHISGELQGFDQWEVLPGQGRYENPEFVTPGNILTVSEGHSTDVITDKALQWMNHIRKPEEPFMLMVHFKAPHGHWMPAPRFKEAFEHRSFPEPDNLLDDYEGRGTAARNQNLSIEKTMTMGRHLKFDYWPERVEAFKKENPQGDELIRWKYQHYMRDYLACVAGVDENIGRLMDDLKKLGLDENTIVMYSSDQGFYLGEHGWYDKRFMYEESFRMPLIARWPGKIPAGSRNTDLVQNIDFAPTFLDLAGMDTPEDMDGESLLSLLEGNTPDYWRKSLYYHYYESPGMHNIPRHEGVMDHRYKLIRFFGDMVTNGEEWEMYDREKDPQEMNSCYADPLMQEHVARLKKELLRLREQHGLPAN